MLAGSSVAEVASSCPTEEGSADAMLAKMSTEVPLPSLSSLMVSACANAARRGCLKGMGRGGAVATHEAAQHTMVSSTTATRVGWDMEGKWCAHTHAAITYPMHARKTHLRCTPGPLRPQPAHTSCTPAMLG